MRFSRLWLLALTAALLTCGTSCKKSAEKAGPVTFTITGSPEVLTALDQKDYEAAVTALAQVKSGLGEETTLEQRQEYSKLLQKVKNVTLAAMSTNESAAKAYQALRFLQSGR